jgi:enoyl-CoA hydratase
MTAGFLDRVVPADNLQDTANATAALMGKIDLPSHALTKKRLRGKILSIVRTAIDSEISLENYQRRAAASAINAL